MTESLQADRAGHPPQGGARKLEGEQTTSTALLEALERFRPGRVPPVAASLNAAVVLDDGTGQLWTVRIDRGSLHVTPGRSPLAETTIASDPLTLIGVIRGRRSGIEAFLRGRLRARGNLSLALQLDGLFDRRQRRTRRPRPGRVTAAGIDTFFLEAGDGPPVVLLHGLGATNASMLPTLWELGSDHHVLAPDLPGFGDSGKPSAVYDPQFFARWLEAFLDAVGVDRAHLVGNSMGGRVALELALRRPERVGKLVLLAPSLAFKRFRQFVPLVRRLPPSLGRAPLRVPRVHARQSIRMLFSRSERLRPTWYEAALDEFQRVFRDPRARVAFFSAAREIYLEPPFGRNGFWPRLAGLRAPALFVWGERDLLVPARFARHVERAITGAKSIVLSDCGHVPQLEQPELTHSIVREFFSEASCRTIPKCS